MRAAPGVVAQPRFALLVLVLGLVAVAQPGLGQAPDLGKSWAAIPQPQSAHIVAPLLGKRWS